MCNLKQNVTFKKKKEIPTEENRKLGIHIIDLD